MTLRHLLTIPARMGPIALLWATLALFALGGAVLAASHYTGGTIPNASHHNIAPAPRHLRAVMERSMENAGRTSLSYRLTLEQADRARFKAHFQDIAPSKGWYAHSSNQHGIKVVLPAEELPALKTVADNPVAWIDEQEGLDRTPRPPSSLNLVNVYLNTNAPPSTRRILLFTLAGILWLTAIAALFTSVYKNANPYSYY